jgi:hypothetical protein
MAEVFEHNKSEETYDNRDHPIPALKYIDINAVRKGGGSDLIIVIASPLKSDPYSQNRLLDKIQGYLSHIQSPNFIAESGAPNPDNTNIIVKIHEDSDHLIFQLLSKCDSWVNESNATLKVEVLKKNKL